MKNFKAMFVFGFAVFALSACGSNQSSAPSTTVANSCSVGMTFNAQFNSCCPAGQPANSNFGCVASTTVYNNGTGVNGAYNPNCPNACPAGQGYTQQYGCQPLVQNNPSFANYNGTTVPVVQQACNNGYNNNYNNGYNGYNNGYNIGVNTGINTGMNGSCGAGYFSTQMGCQPQGNCQYGQIFFNGQCRSLTNSYNSGFQFYFYY